MSEEIVGVIYPVPSNLIDRIFKEGKDVFIKHPTCFKKLKPGHRVLFYASQEIRGIVGEATIKNIDFLKISEIYKRYRDRVFISEEEAKAYSRPLDSRGTGVGGARDIKFLVLELQDIKKYDKVVKPKRFITVGGKYLTKKEYEEISGKVF